MTVRRIISVAATVAVFHVTAGVVLAQTLPYDHMHLSVPDPAKAADWYATHMGGAKVDGASEVMFGQTRFMFRRAEKAAPSSGSVIDHVGFSFVNLDAKLAEWQAAGIKVVTPARDVPGLFKLAFIEDPWGVRIEVVQDTETLGFHHIHLRAIDPEAMLTWLNASFGGERTKMKGRLDALKYGNVWALVQKANEPPSPSTGNALDHLGWGTSDLDRTAADLKTKSVKFTMEPRAAGPLKISFVEGPDGLRIEVLQRP